jgi:hypothetical protein
MEILANSTCAAFLRLAVVFEARFPDFCAILIGMA